MTAIDEVVKQLEELGAMQQGYGHTTMNLADLTQWLNNLPNLMDLAYEAQREMEVMK